MKSRLVGAHLYENLIAAQAGADWLGSFEATLLTDAWVTGEHSDKPYEFLNTVPVGNTALVKPAIVLRIALHWDHVLPSPADRKTDSARYHKGWLDDEAASLASLILGIRIHTEAITREFRSGDVIEGRPCYHAKDRTYALPKERSLRLPNLAGQVALGDLTMLNSLSKLSPPQSIALIKAARLYQQALWLAELDPGDAWLMLVSAVETVSGCWKSDMMSPVEQLDIDLPELATYLRAKGDEVLLSDVATILQGKNRVKAKFVDFLIRFLPAEPADRPPPPFQMPWDADSMKTAFSQIYNHRSKALHDGVGFPFPMTERPGKLDASWQAGVERPSGISTSTLNATWDHKDCPMLLHIFVYIVRASILEWWKSECSTSE